MKIRQATTWDCLKISDLWVKMIEEVEVLYREATIKEKEKFYITLLSKCYNKDNCVIVLIDEDTDTIVGYTSGHFFYLSCGTSNLIGNCDDIYIEKEYRSTGALEDMLNWLITYGKSYGVKEMNFETVYNPDLIKLWERKGYKPAMITYRKEV